LGIFTVPWLKACLGMIKGIQEAMNIQRPAVEPLIVWVSTERENTFQINEISTNSSLRLQRENEGFILD
jgi:hypothetical protein